MIPYLESPNQSKRTQKPKAIVLHITDGSFEAAKAWFLNPLSQVSAHYLVGRLGQVVQFVPEENRAWHAGRLDKPTAPLLEELKGNPNEWSIGIEHEAKAGQALPAALYAASARLIAGITSRWGIPLDSRHLILHRELFSRKACPGSLDRSLLIRLAQLPTEG